MRHMRHTEEVDMCLLHATLCPVECSRCRYRLVKICIVLFVLIFIYCMSAGFVCETFNMTKIGNLSIPLRLVAVDDGNDSRNNLSRTMNYSSSSPVSVVNSFTTTASALGTSSSGSRQLGWGANSWRARSPSL